MNPASKSICGIYVLLPQPVSPLITVTILLFIASTISISLKKIGNFFLAYTYSSVRLIWNCFKSYFNNFLSSVMAYIGSKSCISSSNMFMKIYSSYLMSFYMLSEFLLASNYSNDRSGSIFFANCSIFSLSDLKLPYSTFLITSSYLIFYSNKFVLNILTWFTYFIWISYIFISSILSSSISYYYRFI